MTKEFSQPKGKQTGRIIVLSILLVLGLVVNKLIRELDANNLKPTVWFDSPARAKLHSVELELERLRHRVLPPDPAPEVYSDVIAENLDHSMRLGANWLLRMQKPSGRFRYWFDPSLNKFSSSRQDNFLRQAGTCFALLQVYEMTGNPTYLDAVMLSLTYLFKYKVELNDDTAYFIYQGKSKLGGTALPMLTMLQLQRMTGTHQFDEDLKKLATMLLQLQDAYDTGQYKSTYVYSGDYEYEKTSGWESNIYPGEAMLALAMMYEAYDDERYKRSIDDALSFYWESKRWQRYSFLSWTIQACALMHRLTGEQQYADYVFTFTDRLLTQQNLDSSDEVYGSFHGIPTVNAGSYMEGVVDAIEIAEAQRNEKRVQHYTDRALMSCHWLLKLQETEEPSEAVGGFQQSLLNPQLRIDNTQHSISAFTKVLKVIFDQSEVVTSIGAE